MLSRRTATKRAPLLLHSQRAKSVKMPADVASAAPSPSSPTNNTAVSDYFLKKIHELRATQKRNLDNFQRLEAQRNDLNSSVSNLKEEVQMLQESGSLVVDEEKDKWKNKVLVKAGSGQG